MLGSVGQRSVGIVCNRSAVRARLAADLSSVCHLKAALRILHGAADDQRDQQVEAACQNIAMPTSFRHCLRLPSTRNFVMEACKASARSTSTYSDISK